MNTEDGYCLLYPTKYSTEVPGFIVINPVSAAVDQLGDAWISIDTEVRARLHPDLWEIVEEFNQQYLRS